MRIAIVNLTCGGLSGGYRKYLTHLIPGLASKEEAEAILCVLPETVALSDSLAHKRVSFATCKPYDVLSIQQDWRLCRALDAFKPDVIFIPTERHFTYQAVPVVCMLQNMLPFVSVRHPSLREYILHKLVGVVARISLKRADRVVAVSRHVACCLENDLGIDPDRISVVYHGVAPSQVEKQPKGMSFLKKDSFLFVAGTIEAYRGIEDTIYMLHRFRQQGTFLELVVAGSARAGMQCYFDSLRQMVDQMGLSGQIHWAGQLDEAEMAWCYRNCLAFIMTSRVEACPNTALEALVYGCLIVSTDVAPMNEIFDQSAWYYVPGNINGLCAALVNVFTSSEDRRQKMRELALSQVKRFTWENTVDGTLQVLEKAVRFKRSGRAY